MKLNKNQSGFSIAEIILVILVICLLALVGWLVYDRRNKAADSHSVTQSEATKSQESAQPNPTAGTTQYLEIKELGIKFALSAEISDAYYIKGDNGNYYMAVHSFDADSNLSACSARNTNGGTGMAAMIVAKIGEPDSSVFGELWTEESVEGLKKVDDTYYGITFGNGPCFNTDSAEAKEKYDRVREAFNNAESSIVAL